MSVAVGDKNLVAIAARRGSRTAPGSDRSLPFEVPFVGDFAERVGGGLGAIAAILGEAYGSDK